MIEVDPALDTGCDPVALRRAFQLLATWVSDGVVPGAAAVVARSGKIAGEAYLGCANVRENRPVGRDTVWSIASMTKPFTATAVMQLVERGELSLDDPLSTLLPEFKRGPATEFDRNAVTLRHVLAHCSGLPGVSDDNIELRRNHRPLEAFVDSATRQPLLFAPGTQHYYSNCGIVLAAEVAGRCLAGELGNEVDDPLVGRLHGFVEEGICAALGMTSTTFHPPADWNDRIAWVEQTGQEGMDWESSNSAYYRSLGIPWGGLFSTARDLARFLDLFQPAAAGHPRLGTPPGSRVISPRTAQVMTDVQFSLPDAPPDLRPDLRDSPLLVPRSSVPWGVGWEIKAKRSDRSGDLSSSRVYGHAGATGTMGWSDPSTDVTVVLLTNRSLSSGWAIDRPRQALFSNAVCASLR